MLTKNTYNNTYTKQNFFPIFKTFFPIGRFFGLWCHLSSGKNTYKIYYNTLISNKKDENIL